MGSKVSRFASINTALTSIVDGVTDTTGREQVKVIGEDGKLIKSSET